MNMTMRITMCQILNYFWQESSEYQGYLPVKTTWNDIASTFTQKGYNVNYPLLVEIVKENSTMMVDICEFKMRGEILPDSHGKIPIESQFALCVIKHNNQRIVITF